MRPLIRFAFVLAFLFFTVLHLFAGNTVDPRVTERNLVHADSSQTVVFSDSARGRTPAGGESASAGSHICSCQILHLESSNFDYREVAVFAEKTNHGNTADYAIAKSRIQKEKKLLRKMFFDKVKVVAEIQNTGSCKSMFFRLKTADSRLQLYAILNADVY